MGSVGDSVVHRRQVRQVENITHQLAPLGAQVALDVVVFSKGKMHRYGLRANADLDRHAVVLQQQHELLQIIFAEQLGPGKGGLKTARPGDETVAQPRAVGAGVARDRLSLHPHIGVEGAHMAWQCFAR